MVGRIHLVSKWYWFCRKIPQMTKGGSLSRLRALVPLSHALVGDSLLSTEPSRSPTPAAPEGTNRGLFRAGGLPFLCLLLLAALIATSPARLVYDEPYHIQLALTVRKCGWEYALCSPNNQSAVGPLYAAFQLAFSPLTHLSVPGIRWINYLSLCTVIVLVASQIQGGPSLVRLAFAASVLAVPFLWPASGLALTELPALLAFTLFLLAFLKVLRLPADKSRSLVVWAVMAGLLLGLSVLGRQTYLVVLPPVLVMTLWLPNRWRLFVTTAALCLLSSGWLFLFWRGLVPPSLPQVSLGLRLDHALFALSYVAVATCFLCPRWLRPDRWTALVLLMLAGAGLAYLARKHACPPAKSLLVALFGEHLALITGSLLGIIFGMLGALWLGSSLQAAWRERNNPDRAFLFLVLFALVAAPGLVSHFFSSRYVVGMLSVLLLILSPLSDLKDHPGWWRARLLFGAILGVGTLWTYYR
jgi:hypothetical protein